MTIMLSFEQGTNPDVAQVQVQNKLQLAMPRLPLTVQQQGITVAKATKNFLVMLGFVSTDNSMSSADLSDFIASTVQDTISGQSELATISSSARNTRCASGSTRPSSTITT
jgi:multidrug efflux pump